jgi:uncharacterized protein (DUF3820 family)
MPFGKYRGESLDVVARDTGYVDWLIEQPWFELKYRDLRSALLSDPRLSAIRRLEEQRLRAEEERYRAAYAIREREREAREERWRQQWLDDHRVDYTVAGIMPFGKHKGRPLAAVLRDEPYYRWLRGSAYFKANPELKRDFTALYAEPRYAAVTAEQLDSGCVLYRI